MGYSDWSDAAYQSRQGQRQASGQSAFSYDQQVRASGVTRAHPAMNPYGATRESRDSAAHPDSVAIAVAFDVTGSMGSVPRVLQTKLGALMRVLIQKGYLAHPQVLFGAVGDAYCDSVPLQIGQFESGLEMDDDLSKLYLEGGGGGQVHETYELALYFLARHTSIDCYERRGQRGYLFTIGDEKPYGVVSRQQVSDHIGDALERDIPTERMVAEVQQRYEYFHIIPTNTAHGRSAEVQQRWRGLLGERVLLLEDEAAVCETIALAIGLCEGVVGDLGSGADDLVQAGYDPGAAGSAASALAPYAAARGPQPRAAAGLLPASIGATLDTGRL
ncbi:hypothetical protein [Kouleothrix sp.]|uniref:hypothetical protein n=1 Tax=Kouleothrix sp. TaxID=2779161 RepID=UPI00391BE261